MTPAAGAWLNEWARRTRHIACALLVITQHLADFNNPQGRALLRNSVLRLLFHTVARRARRSPRRARSPRRGHRRHRATRDAQGRSLHVLPGLRGPRTHDGADRPRRRRVLDLLGRPRARPADQTPRLRTTPTAIRGPRCDCSSIPTGISRRADQLAEALGVTAARSPAARCSERRPAWRRSGCSSS